MPQTPTLANMIAHILDTHSTLRLQLLNLQQTLLAPPEPTTPPSLDGTLLVPGGTPGSPNSITDTSHNTWQLQPNGPSSTPTLFLNGYPDSFTGPASLALYLNSTLYFQKITGQWYQWSTNHWVPSTDPQTPSSPEWGPPALRSTEAISWNWLPPGLDLNFDLLNDLFTDTSSRASSFLPSPIPMVTRPRGAISNPLLYQRSDNTFLLPLFGPSTPVTFQFPGLRPTFIRLWSALRANSTHPPTPIRVATGTDTIAVPFTRASFFIIELSLG